MPVNLLLCTSQYNNLLLCISQYNNPLCNQIILYLIHMADETVNMPKIHKEKASEKERMLKDY